jgi:hypothetical protein
MNPEQDGAKRHEGTSCEPMKRRYPPSRVDDAIVRTGRGFGSFADAAGTARAPDVSGESAGGGPLAGGPVKEAPWENPGARQTRTRPIRNRASRQV